MINLFRVLIFIYLPSGHFFLADHRMSANCKHRRILLWKTWLCQACGGDLNHRRRYHFKLYFVILVMHHVIPFISCSLFVTNVCYYYLFRAAQLTLVQASSRSQDLLLLQRLFPLSCTAPTTWWLRRPSVPFTTPSASSDRSSRWGLY